MTKEEKKLYDFGKELHRLWHSVSTSGNIVIRYRLDSDWETQVRRDLKRFGLYLRKRKGGYHVIDADGRLMSDDNLSLTDILWFCADREQLPPEVYQHLPPRP
jgi:hypothetical protein